VKVRRQASDKQADILPLSEGLRQYLFCMIDKLLDCYHFYIAQTKTWFELFTIHIIFDDSLFLFQAIRIFLSTSQTLYWFFRFLAVRISHGLMLTQANLLFIKDCLQVFFSLKSKLITKLSFTFLLLQIFSFHQFFHS